jgi:aromatic ring-opening dioxygenase LigB subunit
MPLVYACIAPHGSEAIAELASREAQRKFAPTAAGLRMLATEVGRSEPDTIVLATPHNLRLWKKIGVVSAEYSTGTLQASPRNRATVRLKAKGDVKFAKDLVQRSEKAKLPVVGANYGTAEGLTSDMPMDWGTLVPLWFMIPRCKRKPKLVIVTPSREIPLRENYKFGQLIAEQSEADRSKRVIFVASADQAHAHRRTGPYGYNRRAKEYDAFVLNALNNNRLADILRIPPDLVEAAKPDSLWQMTFLAGIAEKIEMKEELVSYDVPTYFGMICAHVRRAS